MKVAVCVITYQRPEGLKRLIEGLNRLTFNKCQVPSLDVVVVDNDSAGLACELCEGIYPDLNWPLKCFVEPRRGIPYARNKAVACAQEQHVDFIAFVDDDEVPEPSWLDELLYVQRLYEADVVTGPVIPHFTVPVAPWLKKFFEQPRHPSGYPTEYAYTNNVLVRSEVFERMNKLFDERFALSGGSDTHFFTRVRRAGYKMVWADDALVDEWIPKSRANVRWLLQRAYRKGNNVILLRSESEPSIAMRASLVAEASKPLMMGLFGLCRSLRVSLQSPVKIRKIRYGPLVRSLRQISRGAGMLAGVIGKRYKEYQRTHSV